MGFTQNLFGSIAGNLPYAGSIKDFIPGGSNEQIVQLTGNDGAVWLGLRSRMMQYYAYTYCSPLASVIDRLAESDINGKIELFKNDGTEDYTQSPAAKRIVALLSKPNPLQTWEQFRAQQTAYKKIFGFCPVFVVRPVGMDASWTKYMFNLAPWMVQPEQEPADYTGVQIKNLHLEGYGGQSLTLTPDQFFLLNDGFVSDMSAAYMLPLSKMVGLDWEISNVLAAMEADNVLLKRRGPIGFISHDAATKSSEVGGYMPMLPKEKLELQKDLDNYGMSWAKLSNFVITRQAVKWVPTGFDTKALQTKETILAGIQGICNRYNFPVELTPYKDVKYENKAAAEKFLYTSNVIPNSIRDMRTYNEYFKTSDTSFVIKCDFSELPALQEDASKEGQALQARTAGLLIQYESDVITLNQFRTLLGHETVEGGDVYFSDTETGKANLAKANQIVSGPGAKALAPSDPQQTPTV